MSTVSPPITILAPTPVNGVGPGGLTYVDGVGSTTDTDVADVCVAAGCGTTHSDGSAYASITVREGARLRDAAVDPQAGDYKPPVDGVAPGLSRIGEVT